MVLYFIQKELNDVQKYIMTYYYYENEKMEMKLAMFLGRKDVRKNF